MNRCPVCGEKYSDTYKECPFCEEEEALRDGEEIRRAPKRGKRVAHAKSFSLVTPTLIVLIIIMAGLLVYLLYGDQLLTKSKDKTEDQQTDQITPVQPDQTGGDSQAADDPTDVTGDNSDADTQEPAATTTETDYDTLSALPSGLTLSTTDFTLSSVGETATIKVSGGSGSYTWVSEDEGVASVDDNGTVTAVSKGTVNIVVSDGSKKGVCIVRCNVSGSSTTTTTTTTTPSNEGTTTTTTTTTSSGTLKAGSAVVIGGGNGVRVRSGPGTSYDALATIPNGGAVQIVQSAGDDWYQITFVGSGGQSTTGYMKGEFLANN
jgi:hypothetical protein